MFVLNFLRNLNVLTKKNDNFQNHDFLREFVMFILNLIRNSNVLTRKMTIFKIMIFYGNSQCLF